MKLKEKWSNLNGRQKQVAVIGSVAGVAALTFIVSGFNDYRSGVLARKKPNTETQIITSASRDLTMERLAGELQSMRQEWQNEKRNKAAGGQGGMTAEEVLRLIQDSKPTFPSANKGLRLTDRNRPIPRRPWLRGRPQYRAHCRMVTGLKRRLKNRSRVFRQPMRHRLLLQIPLITANPTPRLHKPVRVKTAPICRQVRFCLSLCCPVSMHPPMHLLQATKKIRCRY